MHKTVRDVFIAIICIPLIIGTVLLIIEYSNALKYGSIMQSELRGCIEFSCEEFCQESFGNNDGTVTVNRNNITGINGASVDGKFYEGDSILTIYDNTYLYDEGYNNLIDNIKSSGVESDSKIGYILDGMRLNGVYSDMQINPSSFNILYLNKDVMEKMIKYNTVSLMGNNQDGSGNNTSFEFIDGRECLKYRGYYIDIGNLSVNDITYDILTNNDEIKEKTGMEKDYYSSDVGADEKMPFIYATINVKVPVRYRGITGLPDMNNGASELFAFGSSWDEDNSIEVHYWLQ